MSQPTARLSRVAVRLRDPGQLTRNLNDAQHRAVTVDASPLRILAGAGSGKTRVLTHRIAYRAHDNTLDPARVLAVTFTRKAATELRERLARLGLREGVTSGTFHSIAYTQLRQRWEERGVRPPELLDRKISLVGRLLPSKSRSSAIDAVGEIEWASARMIMPEDYEREAAAAGRTPPLSHGTVAGVYERFIAEKRRRRLVDFDDLLRLAVRDLESDPVYASARQWRFRHLFIDEFQDVNPLQYRLVRAWLGPESDLCAVGDPNQAIYAWNGADARYLNDFERFFPSSTTIVLDQNYRSTPQILAVANAVLTEGGATTPVHLKAQRGDGSIPQVVSHEDAAAEARSIARAVRDNHGTGRPWTDQAVLIRTNAQATLIVEEFKRADIPHTVRGSGNLLSQPEIRDALRSLNTATSIQAGMADLEDTIRSLAPGFYSSRTNGAATSATGIDSINEERAANLMELIRLGGEYLVLDPDGGINGFRSWLVSTLQGDDRSSGDVVEIMSFHAAKGLEWPIVHLAGMEEGFVPIHHAKDRPEALAEERRLLYVAMTRARDQLICNWAQAREFGSRAVKRKPSPWVGTIESTTGVAAPVLDGRTGAKRARAARRAVTEHGRRRSGGTSGRDGHRNIVRDIADGDRQVFEELRRWRKAQADGADVPAFVVFSDDTLIEIAKIRPTDKEQLLDIRGIGPVKAERYADDILGILTDIG